MKVSIITVCYNSATTIRDAIESVLSQTYRNIEYIIVDGNSTDNTLDIVKSYESKFSGRMRWLSEPDNGLYDAMNKGIRMATGDFVGILNSDDFYNYPGAIETAADRLRETGADACFSDVRYVNSENLNRTVRYYSSAKFTPKRFCYGFMPAHPTFFVRKRYFEEIGYYKTDYRIAADFELLIRFLYTHKLSYHYIPLDMIKMRTGGISTRSWKSNYILNKEIVRACRENGISTNLCLLSLKYFTKVFELVQIKNS
jgi:glycosyltransferase involved in cell wall biosynthesis